ncbi:alkaline phosphatase PhoX [Paenibacillus sp. RC67]|uniref:PhoX family protein n=1 Tax=Paenibacillus sp. RC67 TaxID=3039392 RepID=UPI0024AE68D0|nr:alkaline phosphatase PhoX [Paenibacillus sp. RC67]
MNENKQISRRSFLAYVGSGTATLLAASSGLGLFSGKASAEESPKALFSYPSTPLTTSPGLIEPSNQDELVLPKGFKSHILAAYGDTINAKGDTFGFNNSYTCYHPIDGSSVNGLLWVNHESTDPLWVEGSKPNGHYSPSQIQKLLYNQGGSVIGVYRDTDGTWKLDKTSPYARRVTGLEAIDLAGPARGAKSVHGASRVQGSLGNGSGGKTLWGTQLSGERSFADTSRELGLPQTHYGWVTEIDPFDTSFKLRKQTALGRFQHGSIAMSLSKEGQAVVYMGDGAAYACIYKYISKGTYASAKGKANSELLTEGTLYAANLVHGRWVALSIDAVRDALNDLHFQLPEPIEYTREELLELFKEEADVYVYAGEAALILGATPSDRPETVQLSPEEGTLFITHTNNVRHGNLHGQISRLIEKDSNYGALEFSLETILSGGRQGEFSSPDSLIADHLGNLWVGTNIAPGQLNQGAYTDFKNNGLFAIVSPVSPKRKIMQFASAPNDAALVGPCFTPDERSMFVAVQHPGANTTEASKPTSRWGSLPGSHAPRPAVVVISGFNY